MRFRLPLASAFAFALVYPLSTALLAAQSTPTVFGYRDFTTQAQIEEKSSPYPTQSWPAST
jgi:hypothetical protein